MNKIRLHIENETSRMPLTTLWCVAKTMEDIWHDLGHLCTLDPNRDNMLCRHHPNTKAGFSATPLVVF